jgi:Mg-chelatase subunit ChlD
MSHQGSSLYSTLYETFASLKLDNYFKSSSVHLVYPAAQHFPSLRRSKQGCIVSVPRIFSNGANLAYCQFAFPRDEFGFSCLGRLLLGTTSLLSSKAMVLSNFYDLARKWLAGKSNPLNAGVSINLILDHMSRQYILGTLGQEFYNKVIGPCDIMSICSHPRFPGDLQSLFQKSFLIATMADKKTLESLLPTPLATCANRYRGVLDTLVDNHENEADSGLYSALSTNLKEVSWDQVSKAADDVYKILVTIPPLATNGVYLPYSNLLNEEPLSKDRQSRLPLRILQSDVEFESKRIMVDFQLVENHFIEIFNQAAREQRTNSEVKAIITTASRGLNFDSCEFPQMDFSSYKQISSEIALQIRMISERISSIRYVAEEVQFQQAGNVDLQVAIQAIASQSARDDMFFRDEEEHRDELWTIMVDASKSLEPSSRTIRTVAICIAETAKQVIGPNNWGMFAFSDNIICLKHHDEPFDFNVKSRLGGLKQTGLSHLPDALRFASKISTMEDNSKDKNYVILVTDGIASGYAGIEVEFQKAVSELKLKGIKLAAIGVGSSKIAKTIKLTRGIDRCDDLVKAFVEIYFDLSSS